MKKILSLFTLLLTAVMTFATDYTGKFSYAAVGFTDSFDSQTLTITDNGDGTYDVTIKDFDASAKLNQTFGDMTFAAMPGTTNGGVTTIAATDVAVTQTEGTYFTFVGSSVDVKFNDTKAYFHATGLINDYHQFELTFGEDDFGDTPTDPTPQPVATKTYTDDLQTAYRIGSEGNIVRSKDTGKSLDLVEMSDGTYTMTLKDLYVGDQKIGDITIPGLQKSDDGDGVYLYEMADDADPVEIVVSEEGSSYNGATLTIPGVSAYSYTKNGKDRFYATVGFQTEVGGESVLATYQFGYDPDDEPEPEMVVYTDKLSATNNTSGEYGYTGSWDDGMMTTTDLGDGTYKVELDLSEDTYFGENFTFVCNATENEDGTVSLACDKYEYTLTYSNWANYTGYITAEGKIYGDKLYAKVYVDYGGYAEKYPEYGYGYTFTFGTNPDVTDAVKGIASENADTVSQVYTIGGAKVGSLQKGVNIVRLASGKTLKVLKK